MKNILKSKTIWGIVIAALPSILGLFGYSIADTGAFDAAMSQSINEVTTLAGSALAVYGRVKATTALVVKKPKA